MVNGTTSRVLYIGAYVLLGIVAVCVTSLAMTDHPVPGELETLMFGALAFIGGAHVKPPVKTIPVESSTVTVTAEKLGTPKP